MYNNRRSSHAVRAQWKLITPDSHDSSAPTTRQGHTTVEFQRSNFFIVFGGKCSTSQNYQSNYTIGSRDGKMFFYNDCYRFDCKTKVWTPLSCTGEHPSPRAHHSSVAVDNTKMLVVGGTNGRYWYKDMYRLNIGTFVWDNIDMTNTNLSSYQISSVSNIPNDSNHIMVFGTTQQHVTKAKEEVEEEEEESDGVSTFTLCTINIYNGELHSEINNTNDRGQAPPSRSHFTTVTYKENIILFGGFDGTTRYNDVHQYNTVDKQWKRMGTSGNVPEARYKHASCVCGHYMIVVGGYSVQWLNEVQMLNLKTWTWKKMPILNTNMLSTTSLGVERSGSNSVEVVVPRPRESHTVNMLGSFLYLFGGWSWPNAMNDLFRLNVSKILRKIKSSTNDGNSKTTQELKNKTFNTVVRKVPSVGSIMMTELEGTNSLMVTGSSSGNGSNTSSVEMPMFKVSNKAFRSSKERRDGSDMKHRRSNSNLLVARQTSSPLPNIRQLAIDSGDDDSDDGISNINDDLVLDDIHLSPIDRRKMFSLMSNSTTASPSSSSYLSSSDTGSVSSSPQAKSLQNQRKAAAANTRRKEHQKIFNSSNSSTNIIGDSSYNNGERKTRRKNRNYNMKRTSPISKYPLTLDAEKRKELERKVDERVALEVNKHQNKINEQEQRKLKAEIGRNALRKMLIELDKETIQLKRDYLTEEEENYQIMGGHDGKVLIQEKMDELHEKNELVENGKRDILESMKKIESIKNIMMEQDNKKKRISEMSNHLNEQINQLKKSIDRNEQEIKHSSNKNDMNGKNTADTEDDINETISNLTMKVQEQSNTRKILTDELNHLKNDQNNLKKQISEQMKFFNNITREEEKLRNKVQFMVHHLAGPSEATEDKPYENMTASMFGDGSNEGLNGMMISR
jgi:hypothetical protein